ncbi:tetratricopeptide repeat protein [Haliangium sp.]|uniref:serine/threonine-protein kinase n=1 Tax=Haliangium sp. TaxID=2663208 RepID=UPI003D14F3F8
MKDSESHPRLPGAVPSEDGSTSTDSASIELLVNPDETRTDLIDSSEETYASDVDATNLAPGCRISRYEIVSQLGSGGMGVVYRAYDPELGREVAIKLLAVRSIDPRVADRARVRLLREAQALAQLSHPNVVQVYDVGLWHDMVYLAMEMVEGRTLRQWLMDTEPPLADILQVFMAAGQGLAAAHRGGLIHRDFKLTNVMVGADRRVRILDFGLARTVGRDRSGFLSEIHQSGARGPRPATPDTLQASLYSRTGTDGGSLLDAPLTVAGAIVGTPAFMAPEQYLGEEIDGRADQFGFCVSLYRAVYLERPFAGRRVDELRANILGGRVLPPPEDTDVPTWVEAIITRGLSVDPVDRYPSMEALLADIVRGTTRRRRRQALFAGVGLGGVGLGLMLALGTPLGAEPSELCQGSSARLEEVWNDGARQAMRDRFARTQRAHAERTATRVEELLDAYGDDWVRMHTETCEATHVHGTQSEELLDLRMSCLARRREALQRLVAIFADAPQGEVVDEAISAAMRLPAPSDCTSERPQPGGPLPAAPAARAEINAVDSGIGGVETLMSTGQREPALALAREMAARADAAGFAPLVARAHYWLALALDDSGAVAEAEASLTAAARAAAQANDDELEARIWIRLIWVVGYGQGRQAEAFALRPAAEGAIERAGDAPLLRAELLSNISVLQDRAGKHGEARGLAKQALDMARSALDQEHPELRTYLRRLGIMLSQQGQYDEALRYLREGLALVEKVYGPEHVFLSAPLLNIGMTLNRAHGSEEALEYMQRALTLVENNRAPGRASRDLGFIALNMASALGQHGRYAEAQREYERALENNTAVFGPQNPMVAHALHGLGQALLDQGKLDEAHEVAERARVVYERVAGSRHLDHARALSLLAQVDAARGHYDAAAARLRDALEIHEAPGGGEDRATAKAVVDLGAVLVRAGRLDEAQPLLERGLKMSERVHAVDSLEVADALHEMGRLYLARERFDPAREYLERARAIRAQALRPKHPKQATVLLDLAEIHLMRGEASYALVILAPALDILASSSVDPLLIARARLLRARALWESGRDRRQALALSREARASLRTMGPRADGLLDDAERWWQRAAR